MQRVAFLASVAALAVAAAGCGSGGKSSCPNGGTRPVSHAAAQETRYLTGVTVSQTDCADRVEFAFADGVPGYRVQYMDAARAQTEDASGRHIPVSGSAFLVVRLAGAATARSDGSSLTRTYDGPRRLSPGPADHVREVVKTGDFEAVVTWAIGVDGKRTFTVSSSGDALAVEIG